MGTFVDRTGQTHWRVTFVSKTDKRGNGGTVIWACRCECGTEFEARSDQIISGHTKSCGCLSVENKSKTCIERNTTHGMSWKHPLYGRWTRMHRRCKDPKSKSYPDYGGRGIRVCDEWHSYKHFYEWAMNNGFDEKLEIDRIDNNGDYKPDNCRFVPRIVNARNKRNTKLNTHLVHEMRSIYKSGGTIASISLNTGIKQCTVFDAVKGKSWSEACY